MQHMRIKVRVTERGCSVYQLLVYPCFVSVRERIRNLDDHHAIEERLVLLFLQEPIELREIGMRENGVIKVDERKSCDLDVFLLSHGQQQVEKFALDLQDLDHFQNAAARGVYRTRP